jgi:hypothetical protein
MIMTLDRSCDNHQAIGGFRDIDITQDHRQK